jgi:hypothetical protein
MIARVAIGLVLLAEALCVYVIAEWTASGYPDDHVRAIPWFAYALVAGVAFMLPRVLDWYGIGQRTWLLTLPVAYVVIFGILRLEFAGDIALWDLGWAADFLRQPREALMGQGPLLIGSLFVIALWVRSTIRGGADIDLETLTKTLAVPFGIVTVALIASAYTDRTGEVARAGAAFYAVGILGLACAQLSLSGSTYGEMRAGSTAGVLLLGIAGATVVSVFLFWILFGIAGPVIGPPIETAATALATVVLYPIAWLMDKLLSPLFGGGIYESLPDRLNPTRVEDFGRENETAPEGGTPLWQDALYYIIRGAVLVFVVGLIALAVTAFTRRRRRTASALEAAVSGSAGSFGDDLRGLFGNLLRRPQRGGGAPSGSEVRRLYLAMLDDAGRRGVSRSPGDTPGDLFPRVDATIPGTLPADMTAAFCESRYGGREPAPAVTADLARRLRELDRR